MGISFSNSAWRNLYGVWLILAWKCWVLLLLLGFFCLKFKALVLHKLVQWGICLIHGKVGNRGKNCPRGSLCLILHEEICIGFSSFWLESVKFCSCCWVSFVQSSRLWLVLHKLVQWGIWIWFLYCCFHGFSLFTLPMNCKPLILKFSYSLGSI